MNTEQEKAEEGQDMEGEGKPPNGQERPEYEAQQPAGPSLWDRPEVSQALANFLNRAPDLVELVLKERHKTTRWGALGLLAMILLVIVVIVSPVAWLAFQGKMSSDAAAFLFGVVVGAAFTFLRDVFPQV